jgi:hypothetical protein
MKDDLGPTINEVYKPGLLQISAVRIYNTTEE